MVDGEMQDGCLIPHFDMENRDTPYVNLGSFHDSSGTQVSYHATEGIIRFYEPFT
jgi:hypothetical protein